MNAEVCAVHSIETRSVQRDQLFSSVRLTDSIILKKTQIAKIAKIPSLRVLWKIDYVK